VEQDLKDSLVILALLEPKDLRDKQEQMEVRVLQDQVDNQVLPAQMDHLVIQDPQVRWDKMEHQVL